MYVKLYTSCIRLNVSYYYLLSFLTNTIFLKFIHLNTGTYDLLILTDVQKSIV